MLVHLHAITVLATLAVPLLVAGASPGWRPRPWREVLFAILPIAVVAMICLSLLSAMGVPVAEWAFPLIGVAIAALFVKNERAFQAIRWMLFGLAVGLCLNAMFLRLEGFASESASRMFQSIEERRLATLANRLRQQFPDDREFPPGTLRDILVDQVGGTTLNRSTLHSLWHTWFTGLYRVDEIPGEIWYGGGRIDSAELRWQPFGPPRDA